MGNGTGALLRVGEVHPFSMMVRELTRHKQITGGEDNQCFYRALWHRPGKRDVLVTYLNELLQEGIEIDEASIQGACRRLRPVLMTANRPRFVVPLLFSSGTGSEVQRPLATVVIGGLVTSTI